MQAEMGLGKSFKQLPGLKWVGNQLHGLAWDAYYTHVKACLDAVIDAIWQGMFGRRRRRLSTGINRNSKTRRLFWGFNTAIHWFVKAGDKITAVARKAANAVAGMAAKVKSIATEALKNPIIKKLVKLSGELFKKAVKFTLCYGFVELINASMVLAFEAVGLEMITTLPPCVLKVIKVQCQKVVSMFIKRRTMMSDIRRLERDVKLNF